jgi:PEP-CTERM motif
MNSVTKFLSACAIGASLALTATPAFAVKPVNPPTLHGFCSLAAPCTDNGINTPTGVNPPEFSFAASGQSATGTLLIDILIPNNVTLPVNFTISGALLGSNTFTASLFDANGATPGTPAWTSGQLDAYLGISASPTNPIGAYLPTTQGFDPGATGFYIFQANVGSVTLLGTSGVGTTGQNNYLMTLDQSLFLGSYIVGYLRQGDSYGATANSGAILETGNTHPLPEPSTWAMMLFGFGAIGVSMRRNRRKTQPILQLA